MTPTTALDLQAAYGQLTALPLDARTRELLHNMLNELHEAGDAESLRLSLSEMRGLMRGIAFAQILPADVVEKVRMLFERFALEEFEKIPS